VLGVPEVVICVAAILQEVRTKSFATVKAISQPILQGLIGQQSNANRILKRKPSNEQLERSTTMSKMVMVALLGGFIVLLINLSLHQDKKASAMPVEQIEQTAGNKQAAKEQLVKVVITEIEETEEWVY
jgi:hypothetical protein